MGDSTARDEGASPLPGDTAPSTGVPLHLPSPERRRARLDAARGRRLALVCIDVQRDYVDPDGAFARAGLRVAQPEPLYAAINDLAHAARGGGHPVIWVRTVWERDEDLGLLAVRSPFLTGGPLRRGSAGAELTDALDARPEDLTVEKQRFDAFHRTRLEDLLRANGIDTIVVCGVRTDFCVESTVRSAFFHDFDVFVARDAVAGYVPALHEGSLALMATVFAEVVDVRDASALLATPSPDPTHREERT